MTEVALEFIEQQVSDVFLSVFGDPIFIGIGFLLMIVGIIAFGRIGLIAALVLIVPALFITIVFIPQARIIGGIILAIMLAFGLFRLVGS